MRVDQPLHDAADSFPGEKVGLELLGRDIGQLTCTAMIFDPR